MEQLDFGGVKKMGNIIIKFLTNIFCWLTESWFGKGLIFLSIYFTPIWINLLIIGVFIFADLATALWKAKRNNIPIRSKRLRDTKGNGCAYMITLMV